jgi:hypothetical protein
LKDGRLPIGNDGAAAAGFIVAVFAC